MESRLPPCLVCDFICSQAVGKIEPHAWRLSYQLHPQPSSLVLGILREVRLVVQGQGLFSHLCPTGSVPVASDEEEELPHDPSEETLTIEARFQPLLTETMTKSKDGFLGVSRA